MRNWRLLTKSAGQAPIPQAGVFPEGRSLLWVFAPFTGPGKATSEVDETVRCSSSETDTFAAGLRRSSWVPNWAARSYLRSPSRVIVAR
jgi:hypothetical protein